MYYRIFILFCVFFATKSVLIWNWSTPVRIRDESEMKVNTKLNNERVTLWSFRLRSMIRPVQILDACLRPLSVAPLWLFHLSVCSPSRFYRVYIYVYIYIYIYICSIDNLETLGNIFLFRWCLMFLNEWVKVKAIKEILTIMNT